MFFPHGIKVLQISCINISNYKCYKINSNSIQKQCTNITNHIAFEDFEMFIKEKQNYTQEGLLIKVLKEHYLEIKIFMKQDSDILPNYRSKNHEIELLKSKQILFVRNYKPLLEQKINAMKKYIDKYLEKNFIRPSLLAVAAPVLLVRKPGGKLRSCVDYRAFNKIRVKN